MSAESEVRTVALVGPSYLGKKSFLKQEVEAKIHDSDMFLADNSIGAAREAIGFCDSLPLFSSYRTVLIDCADQLSEPAQDAYLKLCEESRTSRVFFILEDDSHLSEALSSRIQHIIRWFKLSDDNIANFCDVSGKNFTDLMVKLCDGRPGLCGYMNQSYVDLYDEVRDVITQKVNGITRSTPTVINDLKGKRSVDRDIISIVCRKAAESLLLEVQNSFESPVRGGIKAFLNFSSIVTEVPSINATVHWKRACVGCQV